MLHDEQESQDMCLHVRVIVGGEGQLKRVENGASSCCVHEVIRDNFGGYVVYACKVRIL